MKNKKIMMLVIALGALSVLPFGAAAQVSDEMSENVTKDSIANAEEREIRTQQTKDENTIADYKHDKKQTKAKAKEARRVEREANTAARESRVALRSERKAQKSRRDANRQAEKASKARARSDKN